MVVSAVLASVCASSAASPEAARHGSCTAESADGSCAAGGDATAPLRGPAAQTGAWWREGEVRFRSAHMRFTDTRSFNATVAGPSQTLVAFYDPRSQSFKELQPHLDETADALAELAQAGEPVGTVVACNAVVNTYLSRHMAPEMRLSWQEPKQKDGSLSSFKFGQPRFLPVILVLYRSGERVREYTGVVAAKPIAAFLRREATTLGGQALADVAAARALLHGLPGPFAIGCGLRAGSTESAAFNATAYKLHGDLVFATARGRVCTEVFFATSSRPQVVWTRSSDVGVSQTLVDDPRLSNSTELAAWLRKRRAEVLVEMTPDNSHLHLDNPDPLVIFLVGSSDAAGKTRGQALFAEIEDELDAKGTMQLVWSDCTEFGSQFEVRWEECPAVVVVDTATLKWEKMSLAALEKSQEPPASAGLQAKGLAAKLLRWLLQASAPYVKVNVSSKGADADVSSPGQERGGTGGGDDSAEWAGTIVPRSDIATLLMPTLSFSKLPPSAAFQLYHKLVSALALLRLSMAAVYPHVKFDFSAMDKAQKLHAQMKLFARSPDRMHAICQNATALPKLWAAIESRDKFIQSLTKATGKDQMGQKLKSFSKSLVEGYGQLRELHNRLYAELHLLAGQGKLGAAREPLPVARRSATELTVQQFLDEFARPGIPVIITDLDLTKGEPPWTLEFFRERCNKTVPLKRRNASADAWGALEDAGRLPLAEFIDTFRTNATRRRWYLHDWSLPLSCPEAFGPPPYKGFSVPKYFAGDYFQRAAWNDYQHTWPSLFVGSEETQSAMHVDSGGTNFWLHLFSGRKEWRFFSIRDLVNLYHDPLGPSFLVDAFAPNHDRFPLLKKAQLYEGVQEAGELMFIPGGNPHAVRNLEAIHGVSMNYVDASNVWMYLWHQLVETRWPALELFTDGVSVPKGLLSGQEDLRFGDWKSTRWGDLKFDLL